MKDPTDLPGLIETTTHIASQTDRWMFVAMLIIFITAGVWMTKYFTLQLERARADFQQVYKEFNMHLREANKDMAVLLGRANEVLTKVESRFREDSK